MKKLFAFTLAAMLTFSVTLMTACADDQAGTNEPFSAEQTSASSARQRGSGAGSVSAGSAASGGQSGNQSAGGQSGGSGGNSASASTNEEYSYGNYNYAYSNSAMEVEYIPGDKVSELDSDIYYFSMDYKKPVLTDSFHSALAFCEKEYNALSAAQRSQLRNAAFLFEARAAYDNMVKEEATSLISKLPDPTLENITQFGTLAAAIADLLETIADPSVVPDYQTYQNKLEASSTLLIDAFANAVAAIATFEYSSEYKGKLDYADSVYSIMNDGQKAKVAANYSTLTSMQTKYANAAVAYSFADTVNSLPALDSLTDTDQAIIKQLKRAYNEMSATEQSEIPADVKTKYDRYVQKAAELWPEHVYIIEGTPRRGDDVFKFSNQFSSCTREDEPTIYEGRKITAGAKGNSGKTITFTTTKPSVLTIYANVRVKEENPCEIILSFNGTEVERQAVKNDPTGKNTEYTFSCDQVGTYVISGNVTGDGIIYYVFVLS